MQLHPNSYQNVVPPTIETMVQVFDGDVRDALHKEVTFKASVELFRAKVKESVNT